MVRASASEKLIPLDDKIVPIVFRLHRVTAQKLLEQELLFQEGFFTLDSMAGFVFSYRFALLRNLGSEFRKCTYLPKIQKLLSENPIRTDKGMKI